MAFWYKKLILAFLLLLLELISFVLERIGGSNRLFLVASFLLSAIGFVTTIYTSFFSSTVPAVTRSESECYIISQDIGFSIIQLVLIFIQLIRVFLGAKSNNNNNYDSLYPLASAVISFVFSVVLSFRNNDEAQVVSESASVSQVNPRNNEEAQVVSDSAPVSQIILLETPAVDDESAINRQSSTLRQRRTSTQPEHQFKTMAIIFSKKLSNTDVSHRLAIPSEILNMIAQLSPGDKVSIPVTDANGCQWSFNLSTRNEGKYLKPVIHGNEWQRFVTEKKLREGDTITLYRETIENNEVRLSIGIELE